LAAMKRSWVIALVLVLVPFAASACTDKAKVSEKAAHANLDALVTITNADVAQIETGLPQGAQRLASLWASGADPRQDLRAVRSALVKMRREVPDLTVAKSTFFAVTDDHGVAIRNDLEEDVMAGQNLFTVFPALGKARSGYVTTTGSFPNSSPKNGPDEDWIAAVPVKKEDGTTGAVLVTGWTYRYFARHLQESLKDRLNDEARKTGDEGKVPVFYVAVFDKTGVYPAPLTPAVNEKALGELELVPKSAQGSATGTISITDRAFGWAAVRTPKLAPDTGIVVLRSEL
jgi:hypothetical protein